MKKILPLIVIITALFSASTFAQFEIGASYELREEDPKNGFGIRIQKGILQQLPIVNLGIRLHGSYFSDENDVSRDGITYSEDLTNYELGVSAIGGVSLGLLEPYVGLGLGTNNYDQVVTDVQNDPNNLSPETGDESSLFWNMMAGAKVSILPMVKPFVEYRYTSYDLENPNLDDVKESSGIIAFGVSISF